MQQRWHKIAFLLTFLTVQTVLLLPLLRQ